MNVVQDTRPAMPPHTRRPTALDSRESPRIAAMTSAEDFWQEISRTGTPLVEPDPDGTDDHRLVTFLWRDATAHTVVLHANKLTDYTDLRQSLLSRVLGTDVWHVTYRMRADWRGSYLIGPTDEPIRDPEQAGAADRAYWQWLQRQALTDPLNPLTIANKLGPQPLSVAQLPMAPEQSWWAPRAEVPAGTVVSRRLTSRYLDNERDVWIYTPPGDSAEGEPYPLLVLCDGEVWAKHLPISSTLDNLIAAGRIPPLVAMMVDSLGPAQRARELACNDDFLSFLTDEAIPLVAGEWRVTDEGSRTIIAGQSLGGLTSAFAGFRAPERFGNVIAQSGSFWWPSGTPFDAGAEWLTRQFAASPQLPIRFFLEVGVLEWDLRAPVRHLRDVLSAKGYPVDYEEFHGGHDVACWRGSVADGLIAVTAGWKS